MVAGTFPKEYLEEASYGDHDFSGVATSIAAFIGRSIRGPVNEPVSINSFADYERIFGGLWTDSMMSYAVRDFYQNGGSQALIVRLYKKDPHASARAVIHLPTSTPINMQLVAASPGSWGNALKASINYNATDADSFNLTVNNHAPREEFLNVSMNANHSRYIVNVLKEGSELVRISGNIPTQRPLETKAPTANSPREPALDIPQEGIGGSDGLELDRSDYLGNESDRGIYAFNKTDHFNLLCIPPASRATDTDPEIYQAAMTFCAQKKAILLVDSPRQWSTIAIVDIKRKLDELGLIGDDASHAALYFPHIQQPDPMRNNQLTSFVPCGMIAGIIVQTDARRGVWKAPAGTDAILQGIEGIEIDLTDSDHYFLTPIGINGLGLSRLPLPHVIWGARTLSLNPEYKYIPVKRLALYIEESIQRGLQWTQFESNDKNTWAKIKQSVNAFLKVLFRQGAFQGANAREAYFIQCGREITTQSDIDQGIINVTVGIAPLKPAEFIEINIQQKSSGWAVTPQANNQNIPVTLQKNILISHKTLSSLDRRTQNKIKRFITLNSPKSTLSKPNRNKIALFSGMAAAQKTLAASYIAQAFGLPLHRIHLTQLLTNNLKTTERNLQHFFNTQPELPILFFDEADALFGKRSSVKDAHSRYNAKIINRLFAYMQRYRGICIISSNRSQTLQTKHSRWFHCKVTFNDKKRLRTPRRLK